MLSIILDLETLALDPSAIITEIGIIAFDAETLESHAKWEVRPNILEQLAVGRRFERETYLFHREQDSVPETLGEFSIHAACEKLAAVFVYAKPQHVWIQGPDFDRPVLENFMSQAGHKLPWEYWRTRDCRTAWDLAFPGEKAPRRPHHALADCEATLQCLKKALEKLKS
jgi:hypothetical protein